MKKLIVLLGIITALFFIFTSCEKEEIKDVTDDQITIDDQTTAYVTVDDLLGKWNFVSLFYNDQTYTDCDPILNVHNGQITLDLEFFTSNQGISGNITTVGENCEIWEMEIYDYYITDDYNLEIDTYIYEIIEPENFHNDTLRLKLIDGASFTPVDGIYTLKRE
jgi:hypothetical protein